MPPFPKLDLEKRRHVLALSTVYPKLASLAAKNDMTPDVEYDQTSYTKSLSALKDNPDIYVKLGAHDNEHPNLRAVLESVGDPATEAELGLSKAWGFVLERDDKFYLKAKNVNSRSDRVALIRIDPLYKTYRPPPLMTAAAPPLPPPSPIILGGAVLGALTGAYWILKHI